jgi:hypothetical protein
LNNSAADEGWTDIGKAFVALLLKSPIAIVTVVLATFCGYGISFVAFDYRRVAVHKSHYYFHVAMGLAYSATIFCLLNFDLIKRNLTIDEVSARMPFTLVVTFAITFVLLVIGLAWRERSNPYSGSGGNVDS